MFHLLSVSHGEICIMINVDSVHELWSLASAALEFVDTNSLYSDSHDVKFFLAGTRGELD